MKEPKFTVEYVGGKATPKLPAVLTREIGRIVVHWAYYEYCIQEMIWDGMGIKHALGRITVREPRAADRLEMLGDVIALRPGTWDHSLYASILTRTRAIDTRRDLLAHGIWFPYETGWHILLARGAWDKEKAPLVGVKSKRIKPESLPYDAGQLRSLLSEIDSLIEDLKKLRASAQESGKASRKTPH